MLFCTVVKLTSDTFLFLVCVRLGIGSIDATHRVSKYLILMDSLFFFFFFFKEKEKVLTKQKIQVT